MEYEIDNDEEEREEDEETREEESEPFMDWNDLD